MEYNENLKHLDGVVKENMSNPDDDMIAQSNVQSLFSGLNNVNIEGAQLDSDIGVKRNDNYIDESWLSYTDSSIDLDEVRAERQSAFNKTMTGVGRVGVKVAAEIAKMPGMIGGLALSPFTEGPAIETMFNNAWVRTIEDANQYVNNEALPVYIKNSVKNGNIIDNLTSMDFWATEGADGIGYIASMFVPGAALKGMGAGRALMKTASKISKIGSKADDVFLGAQKAQKTLSNLKVTESGADMFNATVANTFFEAGAEAGGAMRAYEAQQLEKLESGEITKEDFEANKEKQAALGRDIFWSNVGILIGPNMVASKILYGAKKGKSGMNAFRNEAGEFSIDGVKKGAVKQGGEYLGEFGKGFAREGFWEEAMQSSVEHKFMNQANGIDTSLMDSYLHTLSSVDGQKAIALGGILGGPMNVYSKYKNDKATEKRRSELMPHMESMLELFTLGTDKLFTINKETGERDINEKYAEKYGEEIKKIQAVDAIFNAVQAYEEETGEKAPANVTAIAKVAQNRLTTAFVMPFAMQGEQGIQILKEALEQEGALIDKVEKANSVLGQNESVDSTIAKIITQAELMQKDYDQSKEYLRYFTPIKTTSENQEALGAFYSQLNNLEVTKKQEKRFLEENKINVENKLSEMEIEMLKDYQLNIDTSNRAYKKFNTTALSPNNDTKVPDVGAMSNERFNKQSLGYNNQETFFEWFRKQDHGVIYDNKKKESDSLSNAMLNVNETLSFLYNKKEVQKAFNAQVENTKAKIEELKKANEKVAEDDKKAKEDSEEEIITDDNLEKKKQERKAKATKRKNQRQEIDNNNAAFDYFESILKQATDDTNQVSITQEILEQLKSFNLGFDNIVVGDTLNVQTSREEGMEIDFIDGDILAANYKSKYKFTIKKRELKEEETSPLDSEEDTLIESEENEELESQLDDIEKRRQEELGTNLTAEEFAVMIFPFLGRVRTAKDKTIFNVGNNIEFETETSITPMPLNGKYPGISSGKSEIKGIMSDGTNLGWKWNTLKTTLNSVKDIDAKGNLVNEWDRNKINAKYDAEIEALKSNKPGVQQTIDFTTAEPDTTKEDINEDISEKINNSKENSQDDNSMAHAKLLHKVGNFADEMYIAYSEEPRDKTNEVVEFELGEVGGNTDAMKAKVIMQNAFGSNSLVDTNNALQRADIEKRRQKERNQLDKDFGYRTQLDELDVINLNNKYDAELATLKKGNPKSISEGDFDFLVRNLSIVAVVDNGGRSHLPFANDRIDVPAASKELKRNIIEKWLKNQSASTTIAFQKPGKIQQDTVDGIPASNKLFDKDGNPNVFGMETLDDITLMFADKENDLVDSSGKVVAGFNKVTHPGHMFVPVKMANGRVIPLKVNQRRVNNTEAEIIFKIIKALTDSSINLSYKDNLDKLKESVIFTEEELEYINTEIKALGIKPDKANLKLILSNFIFEGNTDKNIFEADGTQLRIKDDLIDHNDLDSTKEGIIEWLTTEKNRQVNKGATNRKAYKKHMFNTIITTDAVIGKPLFQGSTAIYLDPTMGENKIFPVTSQKKITKKEVKRTGKSTKAEIKATYAEEGTPNEVLDANVLTDRETELLFSDDVMEAMSNEEAEKKKSEATTLEDRVKPVVKVVNTAKKAMSVTERRKAKEKAEAERKAKNDKQDPCK
tara:strand:- start:13368 stop:18326 length:4959 start_codon:yes stop_codon:yes gene_type:complete